jgi:hypothetical protein
VNPIQVQGPSNNTELIEEEVHRPHRGVMRLIGITAPELIVKDDPSARVSHPFKGFKIVVGYAWTSMQTQQRQLAGIFAVPNDSIPDLVAPK